MSCDDVKGGVTSVVKLALDNDLILKTLNRNVRVEPELAPYCKTF